MPELPDVAVYVERLNGLVAGQRMEALHVANPFVLRSVLPNPRDFQGRLLIGAQRMGKRIVLDFDGDFYAVIHLMIAGRLRWRPPGKPVPRKGLLADFVFENGHLLLTEAGTKRRASLHLVKGREGLEAFCRSGVDVFRVGVSAFRTALCRERHTVKRALTDPDVVDGIGNAYSDEILHRARMSPFKLTPSLTSEEAGSLLAAGRAVLEEATQRLRAEVENGFPETVTAFKPWMSVHGKYGQPCPVCGAPVQRIIYADNEANYCPGCQTGGRILADRVLSRLLKDDWPRTLEELD